MHHKEKELACVVHVDDFTFVGPSESLKWIEMKMKSWYGINLRGVTGPEVGNMKKIDILNRTVEWGQDAIECKADAKHAAVLIKELGLSKSSNGLQCSGIKEEDVEEDGSEELDEKAKKRFRGLAATANYLAADRVDIQFASKEVCRRMSKPSKEDWTKLKRIARYLLEYPELSIAFDGDAYAGDIVTYVDANWAGCLSTRKSTSGGVVVVGGGCVKSWSSTQGSVALSSGESELYALVKGYCRNDRNRIVDE